MLPLGKATTSQVSQKVSILVFASDSCLSPRTGIFALASEVTRQLPTSTDDVTHETIHPSVLQQDHILPQLQANITSNTSLVTGLITQEEELKQIWPYVPGRYPPTDIKTTEEGNRPDNAMHKSFINMTISKGDELGQKVLHQLSQTEIMKDVKNPKGWLVGHADETPFGGLVHHWVDDK